jgi:hypothetical protein
MATMPKPMGLTGPFSLTTAGVNSAVTLTSPGAYALGTMGADNVFQIAYVGRSDEDVSTRLLDHVSKPHPQFFFTYLGSALAAFTKECNLYHDFEPPENSVHPARPRNANWRCPRCSVFD